MEIRLKERIDKQVTQFEQGIEVQPDAPFDHVFAVAPDILEDQRRQFLTDLEKEADHG